jgi:outer membrane protein TolC
VAKAELDKTDAGVREAKREYIPNFDIFAHYTYSDNVPFLARNYGTFGVHFDYDIFDGGKKRATLHERDAEADHAKENLARIRDEVQVKVETAYNKLQQTEQMVAVSQELLAARQEARRVSAQGLEQGTYLRSQAEAAVAQESQAQAQLLQSQLNYAEAQDELNEVIGQSATE